MYVIVIKFLGTSICVFSGYSWIKKSMYTKLPIVIIVEDAIDDHNE